LQRAARKGSKRGMGLELRCAHYSLAWGALSAALITQGCKQSRDFSPDGGAGRDGTPGCSADNCAEGGVGGSASNASNDAGAGEGDVGAPAQRCEPNEALCDGAIATTCKADGSGFAAGGIKCSSQQTCQMGVCQEHECTPGRDACNDGKVESAPTMGCPGPSCRPAEVTSTATKTLPAARKAFAPLIGRSA